jgi:diaminohydroxyphosphoribosylaminopyrimidine deaminase/5-amino-6-(5-phosphoribosylamino)uracil reductase
MAPLPDPKPSHHHTEHRMDLVYMNMALQLARRGTGRTSPNPLVGAVVVRKGKIVGTGYHRECGGPHAEIIALDRAGSLSRGADLYVNLEPCNHWGRTPPCTEAIIRAGIGRVFSAIRDPNPLVHGRGIATLRAHGIEVCEGLMEEEALRTNEIFFTYMLMKKPFVALKLVDKKGDTIEVEGDEYRWIREERVGLYERSIRNRYDAVLVDSETAEKNGLALTDLLPGKRQRDPIRVIVDGSQTGERGARFFHHEIPSGTMIATTTGSPVSRLRHLQKKAELLVINRGSQVDLSMLLKKLGEREITSILVEGGSRLHRSFLNADLADKYYRFIAAAVFGGNGTQAFSRLNRTSLLDSPSGPGAELAKHPGEHLLVTGYVHDTPCRRITTEQARPPLR